MYFHVLICAVVIEWCVSEVIYIYFLIFPLFEIVFTLYIYWFSLYTHFMYFILFSSLSFIHECPVNIVYSLFVWVDFTSIAGTLYHAKWHKLCPEIRLATLFEKQFGNYESRITECWRGWDEQEQSPGRSIVVAIQLKIFPWTLSTHFIYFINKFFLYFKIIQWNLIFITLLYQLDKFLFSFFFVLWFLKYPIII